jgi:hypothetical protein
MVRAIAKLIAKWKYRFSQELQTATNDLQPNLHKMKARIEMVGNFEDVRNVTELLKKLSRAAAE